MLLAVVFVVIFALFSGSLLLAMPRADEARQIVARFSLLRSVNPSGLSAAAATDLLKQVPGLTGPWVARLSRLSVAQSLLRLARQAKQSVTPAGILLRCVACAAAAGLTASLTLPTLPIVSLAAFAGASLPIVHLQFLRRRRLAAFDKTLPDLIDTMARALRAGHALVAAIGIVAEQAPEPARTEFGEVYRQQNFGLSLRDALLQLLDRMPSHDLRVLVTGILVQKDTGGNLTQILDRISAIIRERLKLQADVRVHTAQGRFTGWILCLMPIVMLLLINLITPGYSKSLTGTPVGRKLLYAGVALLGTGAYLIRRIVNGIEI